jgi:o-succinylbenzoate synthase
MDNQEHLAFFSRGEISVRSWSLHFIKSARTSRNVLQHHPVHYLEYTSEDGNTAISECAPIIGLSAESADEVHSQLRELCALKNEEDWNNHYQKNASSVRFAMELLEQSFQASERFLPFSQKVDKVPINGLVWMNDPKTMLEEGLRKWEEGYQCIKFKVGAFDFEEEWAMLKVFRDKIGEGGIIRLDANGAWNATQALKNLEKLFPLNIHSVEQPIAKGNWEEMRLLCENAPIKIALDEELIGCSLLQMENLLDEIQPHYLVLKPSLHGGFRQCDRWIQLATERNMDWWATSALESNIGLNAIYRWVSQYKPTQHQGLGTGGLYSNNWESPLSIEQGDIYADDNKSWKQPW